MAKLKMAAMLAGMLYVMASVTGSLTYKAMAQDAAANANKHERITITGIAKELVKFTKWDPNVIYATVTVAEKDDNGNPKETVYYVLGGAGVFCAKYDGKKVEVNGYPGEDKGKKTITGRSIDVKVIVVDEKN